MKNHLMLLVVLVVMVLVGGQINTFAATTVLGNLEHPEKFDLTTEDSYVDYSINLEAWEYEVRLPAGFESNKVYGLISHIDSGNGGRAPAVWQPVLDQHNLIWLGGKNIRNKADSTTRKGVSALGTFRMTELYNIDTNRIYACGNSGGARSAASLVILRPDIFSGIINNVGSTFACDLPEKFTDPTSSSYGCYEYDALSSVPKARRWNLKHHFDSTTRWVILTAYTDFREDELMNIYHLGHINFGNTVKLISRDGGHGHKEYQSFNDAINFIEHPLVTVVEDSFQDGKAGVNSGSGSGFSDLSEVGASISEGAYEFNEVNLGVLKLIATNGSIAVAEAVDRFSWNDPYGIILDARLRSEDTGSYNQEMGVHILRDDAGSVAGFSLLIQQISRTNKHMQCILAETNGIETVLFEFDFDAADEPLDRSSTNNSYFGLSEMPDYVGKSEMFRGLDLRIHLWDQAIQFTFGQDVDATSFTSVSTPTAVRLMEDNRIVQAYFSEVGITNEVQGVVATSDRWKLQFSNKALTKNHVDAMLVDDVKLISTSSLIFIPILSP